MKLWLTAQEIADLRLEGFPATKRGVQLIAARGNWADSPLARKRAGREGGGGLEYHMNLLPQFQRLDYAATFVRIEQEDYRTETSRDLTTRERNTRDAKLVVLKVADRFKKSCELPTSPSDDLFAELYEDGKVPVPEWVSELVKRLSGRTLARWRKDMRADINRLAHDPSKARKGTGVLDTAEGGQLRAYCLALYVSNQFLSAKHIRVMTILMTTICPSSFSTNWGSAISPLRWMPMVKSGASASVTSYVFVSLMRRSSRVRHRRSRQGNTQR
ncbi:DNA-binding protein [Roseibium marinum]|uniref:Mu DNA-binding protein n=1 Tax=Roseibium marinum TaxID=281252 RepID=A0A2S3UQ58_9HYPH|nr:DNA-binding protein [Roseibium marinum]POF29855.1 Mu DNA-binding protein [Roseibium marinum]